MNTVEAIQSRRAIKHFDANHSMTAEEANEILSLAILSPTAFNIQNYYVSEISELDDETANNLLLRYAQPVSIGEGDWLLRATLPYRRTPVAGEDVSGIGDVDAFAAYLFDTGDPAISFGVGPLAVAPTASEDATGNDAWQLGAAMVVFNARSPKVQFGGLITYQTDVAGGSDRTDVSLFAVQPFVFYQLSKGWYLRGAPVWTYNFENDAYNVPAGVGLGKVWKSGNIVYNAFIEPQYSVSHDGPGQATSQIFAALNLQF